MPLNHMVTIMLTDRVLRRISQAAQVRLDEVGAPLIYHPGTFDFTSKSKTDLAMYWRVYTSLDSWLQIPFGRDNGEFCKYRNKQGVPINYELQSTQAQIDAVKRIVAKEPPLTPQTWPNHKLIENLQQSSAYTEVKTTVPVAKFVNDLDIIDKNIQTYSTHEALKTTVLALNTKYPTTQREDMETAFTHYFKNSELNASQTYDLLKRTQTNIDIALLDPNVPVYFEQKYTDLNKKIDRVCNLLELHYKIPKK